MRDQSDTASNAFEQDQPDADARHAAEGRIEALRGRGGVFVDAVRATRMPMVVTDPALPGNPIVFANRAFLDLSGYAMDEVLGQQPYFMNGAETDAADAAALRRAIERDEDEVVETVQYRKDGSRFVASLFLSAFKDQDGTTRHQFLSYLDITRRVDAEAKLVSRAAIQERLRASEQRLRALVLAGAHSIYRMSPDWRLMYQLDSDTLAATTAPIEDWIEKYIPADDLALVTATVERAIATKSLFELEHRVNAAAGGIAWVVSRAVPLLDRDGAIVEWFGVGTDVTARRLATDRLRAAEDRYRGELERQVRERTAELEASRDLLRATMDASTDRIEVFEAVRDGAGAILGFHRVLGNHQAAGPTALSDEVFDAFRRVTDTGRAEQAERRHGDDADAGWFLQSVVRLNDGVATTTKDITDWKYAQEEVLRLRDAAAQARVRESEERLLRYGEASQDILWMRDTETLQWQYLTPAFEAIYGLPRDRAMAGDNFRSWLALILPEDRDCAADNLQRVVRGEMVTFEYRVRRPLDSAVRWLRDTDFPIRDDRGRVVRIGGIGHDVTELKATEAELAAAEQRQRALLEGIPQLVWRAVDSGEWTWASPQWTAYTGQSDADSHGYGWLAPLHPDDRDTARRAWATALESGGFDCNAKARDYRWFTTRATPVRDADGTIVEWLGTSTDVDELRTMQEHQQVLVAELQHRTRNLIAVVQSMANKTMRSATGLPDFRDSFRDRLEALSRVQGLLSRLEEHDRVTFDELIRTDLTAMGAFDEQPPRVTLDGPAGVRLRSSTVQTLAMALHELATNAAKYGALRQRGGHLRIAWQVEPQGDGGQPWLHVDWRETGVAMPAAGAAPTGTGQGRELIERALPYQLKARTGYALGSDGVHCTISIPVSASIAQAPAHD